MPEKPYKDLGRKSGAADAPGSLGTMFRVECGMCQRHSINGVADGIDYLARTKRVAGRILRRQGWGLSAVWGWICPKCVRVGCASRQPDFEPRTLKPVPVETKSPASPGGAPCRG